MTDDSIVVFSDKWFIMKSSVPGPSKVIDSRQASCGHDLKSAFSSRKFETVKKWMERRFDPRKELMDPGKN
jgi:hypothetical protein